MGITKPVWIIAVISAFVGVMGAMLVLNVLGTPTTAAQPTVSVRYLRENAPAPQFTLPTFGGNTVKLSDYKGKPLLINFWASWCAPCMAETPDLVDTYNTLRATGSDVEFIGIGLNDELDNLRMFAENNKVPYILAFDKSSQVGDAYGVFAMPITVIVDRNGTVVKTFRGAVTKNQVLTALANL
jgi:peroxiredoxin